MPENNGTKQRGKQKAGGAVKLPENSTCKNGAGA